LITNIKINFFFDAPIINCIFFLVFNFFRCISRFYQPHLQFSFVFIAELLIFICNIFEICFKFFVRSFFLRLSFPFLFFFIWVTCGQRAFPHFPLFPATCVCDGFEAFVAYQFFGQRGPTSGK